MLSLGFGPNWWWCRCFGEVAIEGDWGGAGRLEKIEAGSGDGKTRRRDCVGEEGGKRGWWWLRFCFGDGWGQETFLFFSFFFL